MTPGDLRWKNRVATNHNVVHEIVVAFNRLGLLKVETLVLAKHRTKRVIKPFLSWLRLEPRMVKDTVRKLRDEGFVGKAIRTIVSSLRGSDGVNVYRFDCVDDFATDNNLAIETDAVKDLFLLEGTSVGLSGAFLRRAYERLCAGEQIFTHTEGGRLMGLCWAKAIQTRFEKDDVVSPLCFLLHDPYYHSLADRKHLCLAFVKSIARAYRSQFPEGPIMLCAKHSDRDLTAALDELRREDCADTKMAALRAADGSSADARYRS